MDTVRISCWKLSSPRRRKISQSCMKSYCTGRWASTSARGFQYSSATVFLCWLRHAGSGHRSKKVKVMVRKQFQIHTVIAVLLAVAPAGTAAVIVGGLEDGQGSPGMEKNGDFNDVIFEIAGNVSIDAAGGVFSNLSPWVA